mmetsp:Transcript_22804/g.54966  ORF Transcript_22804/g.54966 Transcript_22804/m.54966 type:complete len:324 (-) Transcript_22804:740-1711(-)
MCFITRITLELISCLPAESRRTSKLHIQLQLRLNPHKRRPDPPERRDHPRIIGVVVHPHRNAVRTQLIPREPLQIPEPVGTDHGNDVQCHVDGSLGRLLLLRDGLLHLLQRFDLGRWRVREGHEGVVELALHFRDPPGLRQRERRHLQGRRGGLERKRRGPQRLCVIFEELRRVERRATPIHPPQQRSLKPPQHVLLKYAHLIVEQASQDAAGAILQPPPNRQSRLPRAGQSRRRHGIPVEQVERTREEGVGVRAEFGHEEAPAHAVLPRGDFGAARPPRAGVRVVASQYGLGDGDGIGGGRVVVGNAGCDSFVAVGKGRGEG